MEGYNSGEEHFHAIRIGDVACLKCHLSTCHRGFSGDDFCVAFLHGHTEWILYVLETPPGLARITTPPQIPPTFYIPQFAAELERHYRGNNTDWCCSTTINTCERILALLLTQGVDINWNHNGGENAVDYSWGCACYQIARLFMDYGAIPTSTTPDLQTAYGQMLRGKLARRYARAALLLALRRQQPGVPRDVARLIAEQWALVNPRGWRAWDADDQIK